MANQGWANIGFLYSADGGGSFSSGGSLYCHYRKRQMKEERWNRTSLTGTVDARHFIRWAAQIDIPAATVMSSEAAVHSIKTADYVKLFITADTEFDGSAQWAFDDADFDYVDDLDVGKTITLNLKAKSVV